MRARHWQAICWTAAILLIPWHSTGVAAANPATAIAGSTAVNSVIDNAKSNVEDLIDELDGTVSRNSFAVRQHLLLILQNLDIVAKELAGQTFGQLDNSQKLFFNNLNNSLARWEETSKVTLGEVQNTLDQVEVTISRLPGTDKRPRVLRFGPTYVLPSRSNDKVRVAVRGSLLGAHEPSFKLGGRPCERTTKTESQLEFLCPANAFRFGPRVASSKGVLKVYENQTLLDKLAGLFSDNQESYTYDLGIFTVPRQMGSYQATVVRKVTTRETAQRSQRFRHRNDHCQGRRSHNWNVNARAGWRIDPASIRARATDTSRRSSFHGVYERSESGFQLRARTVNHGNCIRYPHGGCCISHDGRGSVNVSASWTEYRDVETEVQEPLGRGALEWERDLSLPLPERTLSVVVEFRPIDGRHAVLTTGVTQPQARDRWLEVATDPTARLTVLRPLGAEAALAF